MPPDAPQPHPPPHRPPDATPGVAEREFSIEVVERLREAGFEALWAGGCVRDSLLGREPGDYDVATSARPDDVRKLFKRTLNVGAAFGVMIVLGKKSQGQIEVATFRADGEYLDGRRPKDVTFCSAEQDALRRDFTINGMFYDPVAEEVIDYVGGRDDLKRQMIRAIGDPRERFKEDKLRLLRAVRFAARLNFGLEENTEAAIREMAPQIKIVSAERIAQELRKMLENPNRVLAMQLARDTGLLREVFPELADDLPNVWETAIGTIERFTESPAFELGLAALLQSLDANSVSRICRRLRLANKECEAITWLVAHQDGLRGASQFEIARLKRLLSEPLAGTLIAFVKARSAGSDISDAAFCDEYIAATPADVINPPPILTGNDLIAAGFKPGPEFKPLLDKVRDAQLNGTISTSDEALALAQSLTREA